MRMMSPLMGAPTQVVTKKGRSGNVDMRARQLRSVVSATKTCCRICKPVLPDA